MLVFLILYNISLSHVVTLPPRPPRYINFFEPISLYGRWSTSGSDRGHRTFLYRYKKYNRGSGRKKEQANNMLGLTQVQKGSYVALCMCRLTLAWISSENSTTLLECQPILTGLHSLVWTLSHADSSLCCPVSTGHSRHPSPTLPRAPLSKSLLAIPYPLPVTRDLASKTLCLVLRQNRQRNRLLGGPPT